MTRLKADVFGEPNACQRVTTMINLNLALYEGHGNLQEESIAAK